MKMTINSGIPKTIHHNGAHLFLFGNTKLKCFEISCV